MNTELGTVRKRKTGNLTIYLFLIAPLAVYAIFFLFPNLNSLFSSFYKWDGVAPVKEFVGFSNYIKMLGDPLFWKSFGNTIKYTITLVAFQTLCGLLLAVLIFKASKIHNFFRTLYFMPAMLSAVTVGLIFGFIYDPNMGALNKFLEAVGLENLTRSWLSDENIVIYALAFVHVWVGIGQSVVLFVAGLQNIPYDLYESARIDGAGPWKQFTRITMPMLKSTTLIVLVLTTIGGFKCFDYVFVMTGGGATHSSEVLATLLYKEAYAYSDFGYSAAISVALLIIVSVITAVQMRLLRKDA
ncbi:sugar ABC transporter permease [Christensenellaceae bacterium OttesenSCG-928-K19]|nr:sugar ABC transporter permease [Christensenellaceae bacterium OttesenSCG-928-K19]